MPGIRQLLAQELGLGQCSISAGPAESALGTTLLELWGQGNLSAHQVQQLAHCAVLDGASHPELATLAGLGAWGCAPGNCSRDLKRFVLQTNDIWVPPAFVVRVPCRDPKATLRGNRHWEDASVLLPHQMLSALYHQRPDDFKALLGTSRTTLFWKSISPLDPRLLAKGGHPTTTWEPGWEATTVPIWVHGDGVQFCDRDSLLTYSWGSVLCQDNSMDSSFLMACWPKSATVKSQEVSTWEALWQVLQWSLCACMEGKHPSADHKGNPFLPNTYEAKMAGQPLTTELHKFVVWNLLGDMEYLANCLSLPHWQSDQFCFLCDACRSEPTKNWKDFSKTHGWVEKSSCCFGATEPAPSVQFAWCF